MGVALPSHPISECDPVTATSQRTRGDSSQCFSCKPAGWSERITPVAAWFSGPTNSVILKPLQLVLAFNLKLPKRRLTPVSPWLHPPEELRGCYQTAALGFLPRSTSGRTHTAHLHRLSTSYLCSLGAEEGLIFVLLVRFKK